MIVVSNSGPLIALAQIGKFDLLERLYDQIHIPLAVLEEVVTTGHGRPGTEDLAKADWIQNVEVQDTTAITLLQERLDAGESEAVVLALEIKADLLLIDEARGRRIAEARGFNKSGTIGTLIVAKKHGLIQAVKPSLDQLRIKGFHMSKALYLEALRLAGEH